MSKSKKDFAKLAESFKKDYDLDAVILAGIADKGDDKLCAIIGQGRDIVATLGLIIYQLSEQVGETPTELTKTIYKLVKEADELTEKNSKSKEELKELLKEVMND